MCVSDSPYIVPLHEFFRVKRFLMNIDTVTFLLAPLSGILDRLYCATPHTGQAFKFGNILTTIGDCFSNTKVPCDCIYALRPTFNSENVVYFSFSQINFIWYGSLTIFFWNVHNFQMFIQGCAFSNVFAKFIKGYFYFLLF